MKTYFRLLSFAKPIEKFAIPYIIFTIFSIIFSTLNLALLAPLLQTLFASKNAACKAAAVVQAKPAALDIMGQFNYHMTYFIAQYGPWGALQYVCGAIVVSALFSNLFRYLSQRTMENLRVHTLLNFRRAVFNNVMNLHLNLFRSFSDNNNISCNS